MFKFRSLLITLLTISSFLSTSIASTALADEVVRDDSKPSKCILGETVKKERWETAVIAQCNSFISVDYKEKAYRTFSFTFPGGKVIFHTNRGTVSEPRVIDGTTRRTYRITKIVLKDKELDLPASSDKRCLVIENFKFVQCDTPDKRYFQYEQR